jgi:Predicted transcriptional regulators
VKPSMLIGELAARFGLNPKTIRYYEDIGLLPQPERRPSGYRIFEEDDAERLAFIGAAQRLGLALAEIREIVALRERSEPPCPYVRDRLRRKLDEIDDRVTELERLRAELVALTDRAEQRPRSGDMRCSVIAHARVAPAVGG